MRNLHCLIFAKSLVLKRGDCELSSKSKKSLLSSSLNVSLITEQNVPTHPPLILTSTQTVNWAFKQEHEKVEDELLVKLRFHC